MKNSRQQPRHDDPNVVAVMHRAGRSDRVVIARLPAANGSPARSQPTLIAHREFRVEESNQLRAWIDQHQPGVLLSILPTGTVICRDCTLPDVPAPQLEPALRLQAEAHLLGLAPQHRLGMAVLDQAPGENARTGLILAWPESAKADPPPVPAGRDEDVRYVPDIAAIAALMNGDRPTQPLLWIDHRSGSVAMAITHAGGVVFRGLREDPSDATRWREAVGGALAETSFNAGHTASFVEDLVRSTREQLATLNADEARMILPSGLLETVRARLAGAPEDADWWSRFGVAAGAVIARAGSLAPLTQLERSEPVETPSIVDRLTVTLSRPKAAAWAVAICVLILLFGPLLVSGLRLGVLSIRHADLPERLRAVNEVRNKLVLYQELNQSAWPMTKILADIACNTPEGIELEDIRITPNQTFTVNGRAIPAHDLSATEVITQMHKNLRASEIFSGITLKWGDSDSFGHYSFELTAQLSQPYRMHDYPDALDYGKFTMVDRRDGRGPDGAAGPTDSALADAGARDVDLPSPTDLNGGTSTGTPGRSDGSGESADQPQVLADASDRENDEGGGRSAPRRFERPGTSPDRGSFGGDASTRGSGSGSSPPPPSAQIPEPLTEQQVRAMSISEVREALLKVAQARKYVRQQDDEDLSARLQQEMDWLMAKMREGGDQR